MSIRRSPGLSEADADALLSGRILPGHDDLGEIVGLLRTAATVAAPSPTDALAAVLRAGFAPLPVAAAPGRARWSRWSVRTAAAAGVVMSMTLGAAAANALPAPLQTAVADLVRAVTPLELPRPTAVPAGGGIDDDGTTIEQPRTPGQESADEEPSDPAGAPAAAPPEPSPSAVAPPRLVAPADDQDDAVEPDDEVEPDADEPDADELDTEQPDADEPDEVEPDAEQPDTGQPDTDEPDTDEPDTAQSDAEQTDTELYTGDELDQGDPDPLG